MRPGAGWNDHTLQPIRPAALLPLYLVIFIGFCGYSLMITLFVFRWRQSLSLFAA